MEILEKLSGILPYIPVMVLFFLMCVCFVCILGIVWYVMWFIWAQYKLRHSDDIVRTMHEIYGSDAEKVMRYLGGHYVWEEEENEVK